MTTVNKKKSWLSGADPGFLKRGFKCKKWGVLLPNLNQNLLKFSMKMEYLVPEGGSSEPLEPPLNPPLALL